MLGELIKFPVAVPWSLLLPYKVTNILAAKSSFLRRKNEQFSPGNFMESPVKREIQIIWSR